MFETRSEATMLVLIGINSHQKFTQSEVVEDILQTCFPAGVSLKVWI